MPWEKRPLTEAVAALVASWSEAAIDAALGAEDKSWAKRREAAIAGGCCQPDTEDKEATEDKENAQPAQPWWKKHYKEQAVRLVERVRGGARPTMREISALFAKPSAHK